jgi:sugar O-acyltransferase (sialic acid O-acetyltransferase NeuD family)
MAPHEEQGAEPRPLLIFPCNGNGLEALDCLGTRHRCVGFVDDTPAKQGSGPAGLPVFDRSALSAHREASVLAVPGSPTSFRTRLELIASLGCSSERFATVVHPAAHVSPLAAIGRNVLVMAGVVITSNARIGDHVVVLPNSVIHHDVTIADGSLIGAGVTIAGHVALGKCCYIGSGTSIKNGIVVGERALVGLGSTVIRNVAAGSVVAGAPARELRKAG